MHGATYAHYEKLHATLATQGVRNFINGDNGQRYQLPTAEYSYTGPETPGQVLEAVTLTAAKVLPNPAVVVTQRTMCTWRGLKPS